MNTMMFQWQKQVIKAIMQRDCSGSYDKALSAGTSLKDNPSLEFAVVTGCLKIAKESIFTGTNNFVSDTIAATGLDEYFGFAQDDIDKMLQGCRY